MNLFLHIPPESISPDPETFRAFSARRTCRMVFQLQHRIPYDIIMGMKRTGTSKTIMLNEEICDQLTAFAEMEGRSPDSIMREALEKWFEERLEKSLRHSIGDDNMQTNLSYEEFWDGVDL